MKHCTLPTLLAVKTTILPTVPSSRSQSFCRKVCIQFFVLVKKPYPFPAGMAIPSFLVLSFPVT